MSIHIKLLNEQCLPVLFSEIKKWHDKGYQMQGGIIPVKNYDLTYYATMIKETKHHDWIEK